MKIKRVVLVLAICLVAIGFYRGWFTFSSRGVEAGSSKVDLQLTVDTDKVKDDADRVRDDVKEGLAKP